MSQARAGLAHLHHKGIQYTPAQHQRQGGTLGHVRRLREHLPDDQRADGRARCRLQHERAPSPHARGETQALAK